MLRKKFSILELMTVILVILLLISLLIPVFINLKRNARTAICKSQLRQIGVLITSYASSYDGYLPNDDAVNRKGRDGRATLYNDLGHDNMQNNELYRDWNGHLLPLLDSPIKNYSRSVKVSIDGNVRWQGVQDGVNVQSMIPPKDPLLSGWVVINDAFLKGGFQDLKTFICPEIHVNAYDIRASKNSNGIHFPRITKLSDEFGFYRNAYDYLSGGVPTSYLANNAWFGQNGWYDKKVDSIRIDEITEVSKKAFLLEGGFGEMSPYYIAGNEIDQRTLVLNGYGVPFEKSNAYYPLSFVHDSYEGFWSTNPVSELKYYNESIVFEFNQYFDKKAYLLPCMNSNNLSIGYQMISFIDPLAGATFKSWFTSKGINDQFTNFLSYDEPELGFMTGNANILFGDNSVATKDHAWLLNNRKRIAGQTTE